MELSSLADIQISTCTIAAGQPYPTKALTFDSSMCLGTRRLNKLSVRLGCIYNLEGLPMDNFKISLQVLTSAPILLRIKGFKQLNSQEAHKQVFTCQSSAEEI